MADLESRKDELASACDGACEHERIHQFHTVDGGYTNIPALMAVTLCATHARERELAMTTPPIMHIAGYGLSGKPNPRPQPQARSWLEARMLREVADAERAPS